MRAFFATIVCGLIATTSYGQDAVPDRRAAISQNVDFYGSDLANIFDTSLDACQAACLANTECRAFTYNQRSGACFPKGDVTQVEPYDGAISARIYLTNPVVLAQVQARTAELSFLQTADLAQSRQLADQIGRYHYSDEFPAAELLAAARLRDADNDRLGALKFIGAALAVVDTSDLWLEYSRRARIVPSSNSDEQWTLHNRALPAAINGYLRALSAAEQAAALLDLADALEADGRGRNSISALRLSNNIQPRRDTQAKLERAIGMFGFRVSDTEVESNSAAPRICATFNEPLIQAGVDYTPFVQLPDTALTVAVEDNQICVDGVTHGSRYRVVLRTGLPAASGEELINPIELSFYVRDRTPGARFTGRAYVLPRTGEAALPIETVNTDELTLTLRRVSDRNIIRSIQDGYFARPLYPYQEGQFSDEVAEEVWEGTATVANDLNRDMTTRLPMDDAIAGQSAGVYVLSAAIPGANPYDAPAATQWFVLSDLGIATMLGNDGLTTIVRSLGDATAREDATVTLLSRANTVLGTAQTDADGVARFAAGLTRGTGSSAPALVTVELADDIAFLSLTDPAFDLSDRGVEGREPSPPMNVFLATDRGAYRAGETIHVTALMRDATARALPNVPLTAILSRPDGVEYSRITSTDDLAGGHVFALPVAGSAPRGTWQIDLKADVDATPLATQSVLVEDFLPERIDFDLALPGTLRQGETPPLTITARYLFGPPAGDLPIEGEALLRPAQSLGGFEGYTFGRHDDPVNARVTSLPAAQTAADGSAQIMIDLPDVDAAGRPLELRITTRISEGSGRPVERRITAPVLPDGAMIGIKPLFDGVIEENGDARFDVIGLAPDLSPEPMQVQWTVNRVSTRYQWYQIGGNWNWDPVTTRTRIATGEATLGAAQTQISAPVEWGRYEVVIERLDGSYVASSADFYAGWYAPADTGTTPDLLEASLDAESYAIGDTATFRIVPRFAGTAVVTVMSDRVITIKTVEVVEGENLIALPVTEEWGAGAYVTASVIRPMDVAAGRNPARALGLSYAPVDPADKALDVSLNWNGDAAPRGPLDVSVQVDGIAAGETAYVTLAAVDLGILNLTGFESPDPQSHYFGQRKLGVELRDIYGRLIDGMNGAMGTVRSGGDAMAQMSMQSPPPTEELVVFFSGPVTVAADGSAQVSFDLPAFNGTLRLMAVAWTQRGVGQAEADVVVRDPVVVTASAPRFLAPNDRSRLLIEVVHADGTAGEMQLELTQNGLLLDGALLPDTFMLAEGGKTTFTVPFAAQDVGDHGFTVQLTTPDGTVLTHELAMPVRANDPTIGRMSRFTLAAGDTFTLDGNVFNGLQAGTGSATLSVGPLARFDAPGLLQTLDRYPYGCTEQLTSRALPLLYFDDVAQAMGLANADQVAQRIDQAITEILANQSANGAFGLWRPSSGDLWLDAYVTDFLSRARGRGHNVPDRAFQSAMDNLLNRVNYAPDFEDGGEDIAYALMVLAREGAAAVGDLRYFADERATAFSTPLGAAQLGAALAFYGDQTRADRMFTQASAQLSRRINADEAPLWRIDYGTRLRDSAAVLTLAVEAGSNAVDRDLLTRHIARPGEYVSTQEATWTLMAANALIDDMRATGITINGSVPDGPLVRVMHDDVAAQPLRVANTGGTETELTVTTFGVPSNDEPAGGNGYEITRDYFTMEGDAVDPAAVTVGARLVTVITVTPFGRREARLMVNDPLPAGFEIDNPNLLQGGDIRALGWLDPVRGENAEFRSERFLAAVDWRSDNAFRLAYVVRAVSPGAFHHPAASVEDMYRPQYRARTAIGRIVISE